MLRLSGFELYSRWVPLIHGFFEIMIFRYQQWRIQTLRLEEKEGKMGRKFI